MPEQPRTFKGGRYTVIEKLGEGGVGIVWLAFDNHLKRRVAIKELNRAMALHPKILRRFRNEGAVGARFHHPMSTTVFDLGEDGGTPFIVMEYVDGRCLQQALNSIGRIPPHAACRIIIDVCEFMGAFHDHPLGFIHRDMKPGNVLLTKRGQVKVTDFGITKVGAFTKPSTEGGSETRMQDPKTAEGGQLGTPGYMALELFTGRELDARADLYAIGVTLWAILTDPKTDPKHWEMWTVRDVEHPHLSKVPELLRPIIVGCVRGSKEERRFDHADNLAAAIREAVKLLPDDDSEHFWRWLRQGEVSGQTLVAEVEDDSLARIQRELDDEVPNGLSSNGPSWSDDEPSSMTTRWERIKRNNKKTFAFLGVAALLFVAGIVFTTVVGRDFGGESVEMVAVSPAVPDKQAVIIEVPEPEISLTDDDDVAPTPVVKPLPPPDPIRAKGSTLRPVVKTAIAPTPVEVEAPKPAPHGKVLVPIRPAAIRLNGEPGIFPVPGEVPAGSYRIEARFGDVTTFTDFGQITVADGSANRIVCDLQFQTCR